MCWQEKPAKFMASSLLNGNLILHLQFFVGKRFSLIYQGLAETAEEERRQRASTASFEVITPESFYASSSTRGQGTGRGGQGCGSRRGQRSRRGTR